MGELTLGCSVDAAPVLVLKRISQLPGYEIARPFGRAGSLFAPDSGALLDALPSALRRISDDEMRFSGPSRMRTTRRLIHPGYFYALAILGAALACSTTSESDDESDEDGWGGEVPAASGGKLQGAGGAQEGSGGRRAAGGQMSGETGGAPAGGGASTGGKAASGGLGGDPEPSSGGASSGGAASGGASSGVGGLGGAPEPLLNDYLPCEVEEIFETICRQCHGADGWGQTPYFDTWSQVKGESLDIRAAVSTDFMPYGGPPLATMQKEVLIGWIDDGAPPVQALSTPDCSL